MLPLVVQLFGYTRCVRLVIFNSHLIEFAELYHIPVFAPSLQTDPFPAIGTLADALYDDRKGHAHRQIVPEA